MFILCVGLCRMAEKREFKNKRKCQKSLKITTFTVWPSQSDPYKHNNYDDFHIESNRPRSRPGKKKVAQRHQTLLWKWKYPMVTESSWEAISATNLGRKALSQVSQDFPGSFDRVVVVETKVFDQNIQV